MFRCRTWCGSRASRRARREWFRARIDHSEVTVGQAARRNAGAIHEGRVEVRLASVESVGAGVGAGASAETFDRIYAVNSVGFWPDPGSRQRELHGRLSPGGRVALTVQPRGVGAGDGENALRRVDAKLWRLLSEAGFENLRSERLELKPVAAVSVLAERR